MEYINIKREHYNEFHFLLNDYYRDGEDKDTSQEIIDDFIKKLFNMTLDGELNSYLIIEDKNPIGFVIFMIDIESKKFSELPSYGCIVEIGLLKEKRNYKIGPKLVQFAEGKMRELGTDKFYVTPYGKAINFWSRCGYKPTNKIASNKIEIYIKEN